MLKLHNIPAWLKQNRQAVFNRLITALNSTPVLGPYLQGVQTRYREVSWNNKSIKVTGDIVSLLPEKSTFILVDEGNFIRKGFSGRKAIPFMDCDGEYGGPPSDDADAIHELETRRQQGVTYLVILWPAFWWLDYYKEWDQYIRSNFHCIKENKRIIVFDLK